MKKYILILVSILLVITSYSTYREFRNANDLSVQLSTLKVTLETSEDSLKKTQNEAQDEREKAASCANDKNAEQMKQIIVVQNQSLNAMRLEIEALKKK